LNTKPIVFDARSTQLIRSTGWERYATGLAQYLREATDVRVRTTQKGSTVAFAWDGETRLPRDIQSHQVAHFPTFPPTLRALNAARKANTKIIWTLHDLTWWNSPAQASFLGRNYFRRYIKRAITSIDLITPSAAIKRQAIEQLGLSPNRITVIPNGISEAFLESESKPINEAVNQRPYFLYVGTVEPRKNLAKVLEAFKHSGLDQSHDFWLVGRKAWGATPEGVIDKGVLSDHELVAAYQGATATVLVSLDEGFGIPVIESLACGTPVLASEIPVFIDMRSDLVKSQIEKDSLTLVSPTSAAAISQGLQSLVKRSRAVDPKLIAWAKGFTWAQSAQQHLETYRRLVD
jgi:glycosyltransferase involved in cell wall biosynthesis